MQSSDDSGFASVEYNSPPQSISTLQPRVEVGSSEERYQRFLADHGLANEFENSFSSSSSSSSDESDEDMENISEWIAFSKQNTIGDSSYRQNSEVGVADKLTPLQTSFNPSIMSNQPRVKVPRVVINSEKIVTAQKPNRGKIVCELCQDDSFKLARSLYKHKRDLHDMNRQFVCPICSTRHKAQRDLMHHISLKHKH